MRRLTAVVLALAILVSLAPAVDNNWFNWHTLSRFDIGEVPAGDRWLLADSYSVAGQETTIISPRDSNPRWCGMLRLGPPGHQDKANPYAELWLFAVGDTEPGATPDKDTMSMTVQWRYKTWYPGDPSKVYYGAWTAAVGLGTIATQNLLYRGRVWGSDTLGWFNDVQFRVIGNATNDSSRLYLGAVRRWWK